MNDVNIIGFLLTMLLMVVFVLVVDLISKRMMVEQDTRKTIMMFAGGFAIVYLLLALLGHAPYIRLGR